MACILVVEDSDQVLDIIVETLSEAGHRVLRAASAEVARLLLASEPIDLLLADCLLGGPDRGDALAVHAKELGVPSILTTGDPALLGAKSGGSFPILAKPFRLTQLLETVQRALADAAARPQA